MPTEGESAPPTGDARGRAQLLAAGSLVAIVAFAVYANTLSGGFVYDDRDNVLNNPWVREPGRLGEAFTHHLAAFSPRYATSYYRPLAHVVLAATHAAVGLEPLGYHLVLVLLHAAASVAVLALLLHLTARDPVHAPAGRPRRVAGALAGALLFAVHPIHTESVAWVSGLMDVSYALLVLLALLASLSERRGSRLLLAPALFFLALLAKEPAMMLLPVLVVFQAARGDLTDPARRGKVIASAGALGGAATAYLLLRTAALGSLMGGGARRVSAGLSDVVLTGLAMIGEYARLLVLPVGLSAVHDFQIATSLLDLRVAGGAAVVAAAGGLAFRLRRTPAALLGLALVFLPLAPALYLPALGEGLIAERYLYLPSAGLALLVATAWEAWPGSGLAAAWTRGAAAGLVLFVGADATIERNRTWHDDLSLWTDAAEKAPGSAVAHESLGFALLADGQPREAIASLRRALALDPARNDARTNLASALAAAGRPDEAVAHIGLVLAARPRSAEAHAILGYALAARGDVSGAVAAYRRALELDGSLAAVHNALGAVLLQVGDRAAAAAEFAEAVRLDPRDPSYSANLRLVAPASSAPTIPRSSSPR